MKLIVFAPSSRWRFRRWRQETPQSAPAPQPPTRPRRPRWAAMRHHRHRPRPPGATVVFKEAPPPDVAFPPPAPLAKYPVCKRGQFDKCVQRHDPK